MNNQRKTSEWKKLQQLKKDVLDKRTKDVKPMEIVELEQASKIVHRMLWITGLILVLTITFAWIFYNEKYNFWSETISALGATVTGDENNPNTVSQWIFAGGVCICGGLCLATAVIYFMNHKCFDCRISHRGIFLLLMAIMALGLAAPRDIPYLRWAHYPGALLFIGFFDVLMLSVFIYTEGNILEKLKKNKFETDRNKKLKPFARISRRVAGIVWISLLLAVLVGYAFIAAIDKELICLVQIEWIRDFCARSHPVIQKLIVMAVLITIPLVRPEYMDCRIPKKNVKM